jgi:hypothetical protein
MAEGLTQKLQEDDALWWHELTEGERRALKNHAPVEVVSIVEGMTPQERLLVYRALSIANIQKYNSEQMPWLQDCEWYAGEHKNAPPTQGDVADEIFANQNHVRYRLCYFAMRPAEVKISPTASQECLDETALFFLNVRRVLNNSSRE